ncbi:MAG TPA: NADPH:quinone oxidoreductase family protein [Longimicrobiales bacterium]|nr:NADPH:quinone oxidoreductase family protein [Longimicrobiales bacterium]
MKAALLRRHGGPDTLRFVDLPDPHPGPGGVRVRVEAVGINYAEVLSRRGLYGWVPRLPYTPGMEAAGIIDALGPGVDPSRLGESVVVGTQFGAYAEALVVPSAQALPAPVGWSVEERAAFPVNWMTAWVALVEMGRVRPEDRVLVSPAGGGVGTAAVQIASRLGCDVLALAGSDEKLERTRLLGARQVLNYRAPGWRERLADLTRERGVDVALEMVGGDVFRQVRATLAPFGRVVVAGYAELDYSRWNPLSLWRAWRGIPRMGLDRMLRRSNGLLSTHLGYLMDDPALLTRLWADLTAFVARHELRPQVGHVLPFDALADAHRLLESRKSYGKVVLRV